jgi:hypothetical protein
MGHAFGHEDSLFTRYLGATRPTLALVIADDAFARLYAPDSTSQSTPPSFTPARTRTLLCRH